MYIIIIILRQEPLFWGYFNHIVPWTPPSLHVQVTVDKLQVVDYHMVPSLYTREPGPSCPQSMMPHNVRYLRLLTRPITELGQGLLMRRRLFTFEWPPFHWITPVMMAKKPDRGTWLDNDSTSSCRYDERPPIPFSESLHTLEIVSFDRYGPNIVCSSSQVTQLVRNPNCRQIRNA
jgi:hypothetical protein